MNDRFSGYRVKKFQVLSGKKIHLGIIPKIGSTSIRNFYKKNHFHVEESHTETELDNLDGKIIIFLKDLTQIWYSGIYTDLMTSILFPKFKDDSDIPNHFPKYSKWIYDLDDEKFLKFFNYIVANNFYDTKIAINNKEEWNLFENFYKEILFKSFELSNNLTWLYDGHSFDSISLIFPTFFNNKFIYTDINNLNNKKFINWLKENDVDGWNHLDEEYISSSKKNYSVISITDSNSKNLFNIKPPLFVKNIQSYIESLKNSDFYFNFEEPHLDSNNLTWEKNPIHFLNLHRISFYYKRLNDIDFFINEKIKNSKKYISF